MLKKLCRESAEEVDEMVPYALFAYREVPHEETNYSPFKLLYGWPVRGPTAILRGLFTGEDEIHRSVIEHVITIRDRLADDSEIVKENLSHRKGKIKAWYDKRARFREFEPGGVTVRSINLKNSYALLFLIQLLFYFKVKFRKQCFLLKREMSKG
ncbi:unnamed protein product [Mytilus coruscus]|uniref:Uncharacterized protein n=1 Tax=Mytilus coruscus TaxID=42192 RepID=A0A6J7ZVA1_MYTCO|nr:unnamed protein product [Mytilus coruscus]